MDTLTKDFTRLSATIAALRNERGAFLDQLTQLTENRRAAVFDMCHDFADEFAVRSEIERTARREFLSDLRDEIANRRQEIRMDLAGVKQEWSRLVRPAVSQHKKRSRPLPDVKSGDVVEEQRTVKAKGEGQKPLMRKQVEKSRATPEPARRVPTKSRSRSKKH